MVTREGSRYLELDSLRGAAAVSVVLFHFFTLYDVYFTPDVAPPLVGFSQGFYGVQLFFLISGYVILLTAQHSARPSDFAIARVSRLFPTYWLCLTLSWVVVAALGVAGLSRSPVEIAANYTMLQRFAHIREVDGAYWSLSVELIFYVLVLVLLRATGAMTAPTVRRFVMAWVLVSIAVAAMVHARPASGLLRLVSVITVAEYAPLFCCGMLLFLSRRSGHLEPLVPVSIAAAFLTTWLTSSLGAATIVGAICVLFSVITSTQCVPLLRWRPLVFLGEISYPLYLLHQNIGYALLEQLVPRVDRTLSSVIALLAAVLLAWGVHVVVEVPATRWMRRALRAARHRQRATSSPVVRT